jgi:multidrug efflux pump subunit AcrB
MVIVALLVFGVSSLVSTPLELIPDIEMPMLVIYTSYVGAPPEDVDALVSQPIESALSTISGVSDVQSTSMEHASMVILEFDYGTDMDNARSDVKNALDLYASTLPDAASDPTVIEISMSMMATMTLTATSTADIDLANYVEENISPEFERLSGVASVSVSGGQSDYISVELNPQAVAQYGLSMSTIASVISAADFTLPVGTLSQGDIDMTVRGGISYDSVESLKDIPLTLASGDIIHLSDVANVYLAKNDASSISRYNGLENVSLSISKRQSASTIAVTRAVKNVVNTLNAEDNGVQLGIVYDSSENIVSALSSLAQTLIGGVVLAMLVLFVFFGDWRASLIVGTSIPVSLLVTVCAMMLMGFSFNMMSIGGLVIGVGMMVDNSIVVVESCFRSRESGLSFYDAAIEGTRVVSGSIFASTLTTVVVFLPIALLKGMSGELFGELCFTIVFSLIASLISAVTLTPLVFYRMSPVEHSFKPVASAMNKLYGWYSRFLPKTFKRKGLVVVIAVVLLIGSCLLIPLTGVELLPETDEGTIELEVNTRPGLSIAALEEKLTGLEEMVASHPDVDRYSLTSGGSGVTSLSSSSSATITAYLKSDRSKSTTEVVDEWREATKDLLDCDVSISSYSTTSMMTGGSDITIALESTDFEALKSASPIVCEMLEENPYILRATSDISSGTPQAEIVVDPIKAGANGLVPASVLSTVYSMISGTEAMTLSIDSRDYSVVVEYPDDTFVTVSDLNDMMITNAMGMQIPLSDIATIRFSDSPQSITRLNGKYQLTITGQKASNAPNTLSSTLTAQARALTLPDGVSVTQSSVDTEIIEEFTAILEAIAAAVFLVFMVMTMQFESPRFALVVMISIPFALIGSFTMLFLSGTTFNMPSLMGFLMLVGTVVNNGILFIDTTNQMRYQEGIPAEDALLQAGLLRMRPIFMTTLTTILAMMPMALSRSGNAAIMNGMAFVIIGGLIASTILILLLLPSFYLLLQSKYTPDEKRRMREEKVAARVKREEERMAAISK